MNSLDSLEDAINAAGSDNHEYFGAKWTGGYHIQQDPKEFALLIQTLQWTEFENYLVIGVAAGGTERFICENVIVGTLIAIDDGNHPNHKYWEENKMAMEKLQWGRQRFQATLYKDDSHSKEAERCLRCCGLKFNLVGIDGDHSPQGVLQDWELVQPYLAPGALVWFHDILIDEAGQNGARKLWIRLKTQHEVLLETKGKFGIGVIRVS